MGCKRPGPWSTQKSESERRWKVWAFFPKVLFPHPLVPWWCRVGTLVHNGYQMMSPARSSPAASIQERARAMPGGGGEGKGGAALVV